MMNKELSFGSQVAAIWSEAWRVIWAAPLSVVIFLVVMVGGVTLLDLYAPISSSLLATNLLVLIATFVLTLTLIQHGVEGGRRGSRGFLTYLGIVILAALAIAVGLVLVIIPGLILWARWMPAYGYALGEGHGPATALSESWDATSGHLVPILGAILPPYVIGTGGFAAIIFLVEGGGPAVWWSSLIGNALVYTSQVLNIAIGLAIFSMLARDESTIAEVFE